MSDELERLNRDAERIDARERRDFQRRVEAARSLATRCAPHKAFTDLEYLPPPALVLGLSKLARRILAVVAYFVSEGSAGLQVGLWDLAYRYHLSLSTVRRARDELVAKGFLVVTPYYMPAEETKLLGPYISSNGQHRSLRAEDPDDPNAHHQSQGRNLYTLGPKAIAAGLGERCGQVGDQTPDTPVEQATSGFLSAAVSGSDSGSAHPDGRRSCGFVDNSPGKAEIDGSASSPRSTLPLEPRDGDSLLEATRSVDTSAPLVADALGDVDQVGDGDGSEAVNRGAARRGLFASAGWRLARLFGRGEVPS